MKTDDEGVVELTRQGLSLAEIGERLGVTARTVSRARRRAGIRVSNHRPGLPLSKELIDLMGQRLDEGWPFSEIARTYGVSEDAVSRHFPGRGWDSVQSGAYARMRRTENVLYRAIENQQYKVIYQRPLGEEPCRPGGSITTMPGQPPTDAPQDAQIGTQRPELASAA